MAEEGKQEEMCDICGGTPCDWEVYGEDVLADITKMYLEDEEEASNSLKREISLLTNDWF